MIAAPAVLALSLVPVLAACTYAPKAQAPATGHTAPRAAPAAAPRAFGSASAREAAPASSREVLLTAYDAARRAASDPLPAVTAGAPVGDIATGVALPDVARSPEVAPPSLEPVREGTAEDRVSRPQSGPLPQGPPSVDRILEALAAGGVAVQPDAHGDAAEAAAAAAGIRTGGEGASQGPGVTSRDLLLTAYDSARRAAEGFDPEASLKDVERRLAEHRAFLEAWGARNPPPAAPAAGEPVPKFPPPTAVPPVEAPPPPPAERKEAGATGGESASPPTSGASNAVAPSLTVPSPLPAWSEMLRKGW